MSKQAFSTTGSDQESGHELVQVGGGLEDTSRYAKARPIPRISIQAFCENVATAEVLQSAAGDRRLAKSHVSMHMGGVPAAVAHFHESPTPNLIIVETTCRAAMLIGTRPPRRGLRCRHQGGRHRPRQRRRCSTASCCGGASASTWWRPFEPLQIIESISNLYTDPDTGPIGQVIAFIGAKGGVGSSTVCHNTAFAIAVLKADVVIADLDLPFGTAGLDFNQDPSRALPMLCCARAPRRSAARPAARPVHRPSSFSPPRARSTGPTISADTCDTVLDVVRENVPLVRSTCRIYGRPGSSACCSAPTTWSSRPRRTSPICATPRT